MTGDVFKVLLMRTDGCLPLCVVTDAWTVLIAVQGMHADIHMHDIRGEMQGTCRSQTPEI